ncbi:MAG: hypothetical protein SGI92_11100 [Bryobacteraceae bacterium]|nr:hypothetical protein [Bryobacteraceae bacterium]
MSFQALKRYVAPGTKIDLPQLRMAIQNASEVIADPQLVYWTVETALRAYSGSLRLKDLAETT